MIDLSAIQSETSYLCQNEKETQELASKIALSIGGQEIILLNGPLGAGKSVFARHLIKTLLHNEEEDIPSPTFTLVQQYETVKGTIWHYDLYRLNNPEEVYETGWEDIVGQDITIIEWAEKLEYLKPENAININIFIEDNNTRKIMISSNK